MTHNIVAQFSCSLDEHGNFNEYRVISGSVFNEEYNETLDSGTIVLSQIPKELRLSDIKSYQYVRVFDKNSTYDAETGAYKFDKIFLVDNFNEKENNIKEHIFGYTINLMSETKLLEKFQCPNLTITHDVKNGVITKKTIFEHIRRYMELYIPKIKFCEDGKNWKYEPLIKVPGVDNNYHEDVATINFTSGNFEFISGHGRDYYGFSCESSQLSSTIDYNTVEMLGEPAPSPSNVQWWEGSLVGGFSIGDGTFKVNGYSDNTGSGFITIRYRYKLSTVNTEFFERFNHPCADLAFTAPTLRQLLTVLMQQVGCVPVVRNRTLGFLDFQKDVKDFGNGDYSINNTVNYITRSLSSDSFVNTLINMSEQVLDSGNEVVCETLGFRNRSELLLKQKENLELETSLPIYKVNKCIMRFPGKYEGYLSSSVGCIEWDTHFHWPILMYRDNTVQNNVAKIKIAADFFYSNSYTVKINNHSIYFLGRRNDGSYYIISQNIFNDFVLNSSTTTPEMSDWDEVGSWETNFKTFTFSNLNPLVIGFVFSGTFINQNGDEHDFSFIKFDDNDSNLNRYGWINDSPGYSVSQTVFVGYNMNFGGNRKWDISKLIVEESVRQLLDRDFVKMVGATPNDGGEMKDPATWTIDNLSKYVYGTVGYSIGSKIISGFSDVYNTGSAALGWVQKEYTYIENIINVLKDYYDVSEAEGLLYHFFGFLNVIPIQSQGKWPDPNYSYLDTFINDMSRYLFVNFGFKYYSPKTESFSGEPFFSTCMFDIYYQPLNSFNLGYVKSQEEIDYPLEQYDGNASGLTDFDRLSVHEQEQVDRIGNETLSIQQRTTDFEDIQNFENGPLSFKEDTNRSGEIDESDNGINYIIFKRSFGIGNNCFNASYVGSKDAVLKNYFTSIRTKYRAYQYVDYSQSVLRKERDTLFVRISSDYYDGDDKIFFGNKTNEENSDLSFLDYVIYDINGSNNISENDVPRKISYEIEKDNGKISNGLAGYYVEEQTVKNSVSCYSTNNMLGITYEYVDNVGAGPYIRDLTTNTNLGGIPQCWQIWDDDYSARHEVAFTNYIDFYSQMITNTGDASVITNQIKKIEMSPIVDSSYHYAPIFYVVDNNKDYRDLKRTFYKDYAERINHTIQFIYYAPKKDILISEDFIAGTPMIQRYEKPFNMVLGSTNEEDFAIDGNLHEKSSSESQLPMNRIELIKDNNIYNPAKLRVHFNSYKIIKMVCFDNVNKYSDLAVFKCPKELYGQSNATVDYYFMINDTKTDYVLSEKNGILYRRYKTKAYKKSEIVPYPVLDYLENTGTQYIYLNLTPSADYEFELRYTDTSAVGSNYVMGSRVNSGTIYAGVTGASATSTITIANTNLSLNNYRVAGRTYLVRAKYNASITGSCSIFCETTGETFKGEQNVSLSGATASVYLFALNSSQIHRGMRVHYLKIWRNGVLVRDLVPVLFDNTGYFYDRINNLLYQRSGTGSFILGPQIDQVAYPRKVVKIYDEED